MLGHKQKYDLKDKLMIEDLTYIFKKGSKFFKVLIKKKLYIFVLYLCV